MPTKEPINPMNRLTTSKVSTARIPATLNRLAAVFLITVCSLAGKAVSDDTLGFELKDGDRVLFIGDTFVERARYSSYIETMLASHFPGRSITFRNFGWSGDTPNIQPRPLGFGDLKTHVERIKPTVAIIDYGMNSSFDGPEGLDRFIQGYEAILDMLEASGARIVLLSPIRHERMGPNLPDPTEHNKNLRLYVDAISALARRRDYPFVNLFDRLSQGRREAALTDNGIHPNDYGYWRAGWAIANALGAAPRLWRVNVGIDESERQVSGTQMETIAVDRVENAVAGVRFTLRDEQLPPPPAPADAPEGAELPGGRRILKISDLSPGRYMLKIDGRSITSASAEQWAKGVELSSGPEFDRAEKLRQIAKRKNQQFFYRWRPHNGEYIFGRRKKKSGGNAGNEQFAEELQKMDELIAEDDGTIAQLTVPAEHAYELQAIEP